MALSWIGLGAFILCGFTLEVMSGFGGTVIALALGALLLPIATLVPVLVPLSMTLGLAMAWHHRGHIDRHLLLRVVLPGMAAGTAVGYAVKPWLDEAVMRPLFGALIVWFAARALWRNHHATPMTPRPAWLTQTLITLAGVTHGLFASGGPLLVYALSGLSLNKARFRITLIVVWLALDSGLTLAFWLDGRLGPALPMVAAYLPVIGVGWWLGEWLHLRVSEARFRTLVAAVLLVTGCLLVWPR